MTDSVDKRDLASTVYCDWEHPSIRERARALGGEGLPSRQKVLNTFRWVRDEIPFGFDFIKVKASDTLRKGYGACFNKSLLLTALFRAQGLAARFCTVPVHRRFMKPYIGWLYLLINHPYRHCMVRVELEGQWSFAEPTLDRRTYESIFRPLGVEWSIEWSPERPDRLYLEHLLGEPTVHQDVDDIIGRNVGNSMLPAPMVRALCAHINRKAWGRVGLRPAAQAAGGHPTG